MSNYVAISISWYNFIAPHLQYETTLVYIKHLTQFLSSLSAVDFTNQLPAHPGHNPSPISKKTSTDCSWNDMGPWGPLHLI